MATTYYWHYDEHHRWVSRHFGAAAGAHVPVSAAPSQRDLARSLWDWLVEVHGEALDVEPLQCADLADRVLLVLLDVHQRTDAEVARSLQTPLREIRLRHDAQHRRLRLPEPRVPMCTHWGEVRSIHHHRGDEDHVAEVRRHFDRCAACQKGARGLAAIRAWWLARLGPLGELSHDGVHRVIPAFAGERIRVD